MDKVKQCIDRIRAIRGVSNGEITYKQLECVFSHYQADEDVKKQVYEYLEENGIIPDVDEDPAEVEAFEEKRQAFIEEFTRVPAVQLLSEDTRKKRFEDMLEQCTNDIYKKPALAAQYYEEFGKMKKYIVNTEFHEKWLPSRCIIMALFYISSCRVREKRRNGWVCGTHMNNVKQRFELQIRHLFAEEELSGLMDVCMHDGELSERQAQVLAVLLHNTPKTVVSHHLGFEDLI